MKWVKLPDYNVWISEREVNFETSRIKEHDGRFYAYGTNHSQMVQKDFTTLKEAKKWVQDCTGWDAMSCR